MIVLAGCGGDDASSQRLDPAVAARLADESDAVAVAIEANDGCEAARRVAALRSSLEQVSVPDAVRRQVGRYAGRSFTCLPPAPPPPPPAPPPPVVSTSDEEDHDRGKGKHKGHEKKRKKHDHDEGGDE
ncbi:MAG: hypothetical protein ACJ75P_08280 [Gaiellaceae bacterium]